MPLIAHSELPAFQRLRAEGYEILSPHEAIHQDIRELHIGLVNLMPDAALRATERQFLRLLGACNRIVQIRVHLITLDEPSRGSGARAYLAEHYEKFDEVQRSGLDALILTGANPASPDLETEDFWAPLLEVLAWAKQNVASTLCSCLASHAVLQEYFAVQRRRRPEKLWGVFSHKVVAQDDPLVRHVNTRFDAPRSHIFEITPQQVEGSGCRVLVASQEHGLHLATSPDGLRFVFFQGHPEYDTESLLKEYKREVQRFAAKERGEFPAYPKNYLGEEARAVLDENRRACLLARQRGERMPDFPEGEVRPLLENTWTDTGKAIINNWLGQVYRLMS